MDRVSKEIKENKDILPHQQELEQARLNPDGWVYRIAGSFLPSDAIPPEAIVGAWKVDSNGRIQGEFLSNPKYDVKRWPS